MQWVPGAPKRPDRGAKGRDLSGGIKTSEKGKFI